MRQKAGLGEARDGLPAAMGNGCAGPTVPCLARPCGWVDWLLRRREQAAGGLPMISESPLGAFWRGRRRLIEPKAVPVPGPQQGRRGPSWAYCLS